jgi:hypothetical protein
VYTLAMAAVQESVSRNSGSTIGSDDDDDYLKNIPCTDDLSIASCSSSAAAGSQVQ